MACPTCGRDTLVLGDCPTCNPMPCSICGSLELCSHVAGAVKPESPFLMLFTGQAPGAIPNGTVIEKVNSAPGDGHLDGSLGRVIGSEAVAVGYAYFIEWNDVPGVPVGVLGQRIRVMVGGTQ